MSWLGNTCCYVSLPSILYRAYGTGWWGWVNVQSLIPDAPLNVPVIRPTRVATYCRRLYHRTIYCWSRLRWKSRT